MPERMRCDLRGGDCADLRGIKSCKQRGKKSPNAVNYFKRRGTLLRNGERTDEDGNMRETLGILLGFFLAAALGYLISGIRQKEQEKEILESYMDSFQEIYEIIRQRMDVTRKFRHDLLSHVQTLEYLIEKQKDPDQELRKYADQLTEEYRKIQRGAFCRDEITDAFLMMEKQVCTEKEIPFQIQVSKICMEWMMPVERIGFLHNLLDNAIEANGRIPENERKEISFYIEEDSRSCTVELKNALASNEVFSFKTWKTDGAEHGVGTTIIHAIVEKYHGTSKTLWDKENHSLDQKFVFPIEHLTEKRKTE